MLEALPYDSLLAMHLLAVAIFLAGLFLTATLLPGLTRPAIAEAKREEGIRLRKINLFLTTPALLLLWLCGIGMTLAAGWYQMNWLPLKAALVAGLSALHGQQMRQLRLLALGQPLRPARYRMLAVIGVTVVAIGILVIAKPF